MESLGELNSKVNSKEVIEKFSLNLIYNIVNEIKFEDNNNLNLFDNCYEENSEKSEIFFNSEIEKFFESTKIREKYSISIIKTKEQNGGALCGFFSLFNLINFLQFLKNRDNKKKQLFYLRKLNSTPQFWCFYRDTVNFLLDSIMINRTDKKSLLKMGPLERYQFKYILQAHPEIKKLVDSDINNQIKILHYFYGFNFIQSMSKQEIIELQKDLEFFKTYKEDKHLIYVILLGVTDHWSILILDNSKGEIKNYYLDSNKDNAFILNPVDEFEFLQNKHIDLKKHFIDLKTKNDEIEKFVDYSCKEIEKYRIEPISPWFRRCYVQWTIDINLVVRDIFRIIYDDENHSFYEIYLNSMIWRLTKTFEEYISIKLESEEDIYNYSEDIFLIKEKFLQWLMIEYHPKVLKVDILNTFESFADSFYVKNLKNKSIYGQFSNWIQFSKNVKDKIHVEESLMSSDPQEKSNAVLIKRYYEVIEELEKFL